MPAYLPITLIIVSDYEPGPKTWADEDAAVRAYTNDPAGAPAEIIVAAATQDEATPHPDWTCLNVKMVSSTPKPQPQRRTPLRLTQATT